MTPTEVAKAEQGVVRVYALDLPETEARAFASDGAALQTALGARAFDPAHAELLRLADLGELGLSGYLAEGHDIPPEEVDAARLDAEDGHALVLRSPAFMGVAQALAPGPPLRPLGAWREPGAGPAEPWRPEVESARPAPAPAPAPEPEPQSGDRFAPDRGAYLRDHVVLAAVGMIGAPLVLWLLGISDAWVGAVAALLAVGVRGAYLYSEEMGHVWTLSEGTLSGPGGRRVALSQIAQVRRIGSSVQVVTRGGDKHLIKFQADPAAARTRLARAAGLPE